MKINKKRITASLMSLVMAGSLVFDSGMLANAAQVGVTFSKMNGSNIDVADYFLMQA